MEFVFNIEPTEVGEVIDSKGKKKITRPRPVRERIGTQSLLAAWIATGVILAGVFWCFVFFSPLTYGTPGLEVPQVLARKWLNYDLHFAK